MISRTLRIGFPGALRLAISTWNHCARALALLTLGMVLHPGPASAGVREVVLQWLPPAAVSIDGYAVYIGEGPGAYLERIDLGMVPTDPDGIGRSVLNLDAAVNHYAAMTSYNEFGESLLSNEILIAAIACDPTLCDDDNPCTSDGCSDASCVYTPLPEGTLCDSPSGWPLALCLAGVCQDAECLQDANCASQNLCDGIATCEGYACVAGSPLECPPETACLASGCSPDTGCWTRANPDGTPCDDGRVETRDDACLAGDCVGTPWDPECREDAHCSDGNVCNGQELCGADGTCTAGPPLHCGSPTQCMDPFCDPIAGCQMNPRPDGTPCDDGRGRTQEDHCEAGVCVSTKGGKGKGKGPK